jgi:acyl carrier protein
MPNEALESVLIDAICNCLAASGREVPEMNPETVPLEGIAGFDSLCAVEVLVDVEARCGLKVNDDVFLSGKGAKARHRTIREIADAITQSQK